MYIARRKLKITASHLIGIAIVAGALVVIQQFILPGKVHAQSSNCIITDIFFRDPQTTNNRDFKCGGPFTEPKSLHGVALIQNCQGIRLDFQLQRNNSNLLTRSETPNAGQTSVEVDFGALNDGQYKFKVAGSNVSTPFTNNYPDCGGSQVVINNAPLCNFEFTSFSALPNNIPHINNTLTLSGTVTQSGVNCTEDGFIKIEHVVPGTNAQPRYIFPNPARIRPGQRSVNFSTTVSPGGDLGYAPNTQSLSFKANIFQNNRPVEESSVQNVTIGTSQRQNPYKCVNNTTCEECTDLNNLAGCVYQDANVCSSSCPPNQDDDDDDGTTQQFEFKIPNPLCDDPNDPKCPKEFSQLLDAIGTAIFNFVLVAAPIIIIWAGILFMTSRGDTGKVTTARKALTYALIGLAVVLIGKGFVTLIKSILSLGGPPGP